MSENLQSETGEDSSFVCENEGSIEDDFNENNLVEEQNFNSEEWNEVNMSISADIEGTFEGKCILENIKDMKPIELFELFVTNELINIITYQTNLYYKQCNEKRLMKDHIRWNELNCNQIRAFIGILLYTRLNYRDNLHDHWSPHELLRTAIADKISYQYFFMIWKYFHLEDNSKMVKSIEKVSHIIYYVEEKWNSVYSCGASVTLDETMIPTQARSRYLQYAPKKPCKWGIKAFSVTDSKTRYMCKFWVYEGKGSFNSASEMAVKRTLDFLDGKRHILYMDSYFSSINVFEYALNKEINCIGMVNKNRKFLPKDVRKRTDINKHDIKYYQKKNMNLVQYKDKRIMNILSTIPNDEVMGVDYYNKKNKKKEQKKIPIILVNYSQKMRGVDVNNQLTSYYLFDNRVYKWWKSVFLYILQLCVTNAYILYTTFSNPELSHKSFLLSIIEDLMNSYEFLPKKKILIDINMFYYKLEKKRNVCKTCKLTKTTTLTYYFCNLCKQATCVSCQYNHMNSKHEISDYLKKNK